MKRILLSAFITLFAIAATGCNTIQGVGKDVQKAGEKLEDAAKKK